MFAYVNHARIRSWNQPVLSKEGKVSCSRKERGPLLGLELTSDRHPPTTSQTRYPMRHAALPVIVTYPYTRLYSLFGGFLKMTDYEKYWLPVVEST